ncbi:MAG: hypothetical protein V3V31_00300 [Methylococcales bacterium]
MIEKSDSKWISLAAASILGQAPRHRTAGGFISFKVLQRRSLRQDVR